MNNTIIPNSDNIHFLIEKNDKLILQLFSNCCNDGNLDIIKQFFKIIPNLSLITFNNYITLNDNEHFYISEGFNIALDKKCYDIIEYILYIEC